MSVFACQFMRVEGYGEVPNPKRRRNGHRSARQVVEELVREPHASPHVPIPLPPRIIAGDPYQTLANARRRTEGYVDPLGRKLRRDAHIVAGCVVSYPVPVEQVQADEHEGLLLQKWVGEVHQWAKREFGESNIDCVVQHMDETNPHLHIMLLRPEPGLNPSPLSRVGKAARAAAKKDGKKRYRKDYNLIENAAFRAEGKRLQDSLYESVSCYFGHLRKSSDPRTRMPNPVYKKVKAQQATLRRTLEAVKQREREALEQLEEQRRQQQLLDEMRMSLERKEARIQEEAEELAAREAALAAREAALAARQVSLGRILGNSATLLVGSLLHHGANVVRAKLGAEATRLLQSAIRVAQNAIGLPEAAINTSAGDLDEAQLNAMFRDFVDAHRQAVNEDANVQLRELMSDASRPTPVPRPSSAT